MDPEPDYRYLIACEELGLKPTFRHKTTGQEWRFAHIEVARDGLDPKVYVEGPKRSYSFGLDMLLKNYEYAERPSLS